MASGVALPPRRMLLLRGTLVAAVSPQQANGGNPLRRAGRRAALSTAQ